MLLSIHPLLLFTPTLASIVHFKKEAQKQYFIEKKMEMASCMVSIMVLTLFVCCILSSYSFSVLSIEIVKSLEQFPDPVGPGSQLGLLGANGV